MRITEEEFNRIGGIEDDLGLSDADLKLAVRAKRLTIAYLEGRGSNKWQLALTPLYHELYALEGFVEARKRDRQ
jgi:hypothetical protein